MRSLRLFQLLFFAGVLCSCVFLQPQPKLTPLEVEALQTREYEAHLDVVYPSVVSVLQFYGYIIKSSDKASGLLSAEGPAKKISSSFGNSFLSSLSEVLAAHNGVYVNNSSPQVIRSKRTKLNAFIEVIPPVTRVRLSFVTSFLENGVEESKPIIKPKIYQDFFEKIDNEIFVRNARK